MKQVEGITEKKEKYKAMYHKYKTLSINLKKH